MGQINKVYHFLCLVLVLVSPYLVGAQESEFSFNFDIIDAEYSSKNGILNFDTKTQVGTINAKKFEFDTDLFSFYVHNDQGVQVIISADGKKFSFESD